MHTIRLHGPWEYTPLTDERGSLLPAGRITLPADWSETLGADFRGRVRYTRRFHRPTGLDGGHRVFLSIECVDAFGAAWLNDEKLGELSLVGGPFRFDVTERLRRANLLTIEVELPREKKGVPPPVRPGRENLAGGPIGSVRLEIIEP